MSVVVTGAPAGSPEASQTTSVVVTGAPAGMSINSMAAGSNTSTQIQWTPSSGSDKRDCLTSETVNLTIVATNDGKPAGKTT
jgi:hypothetical protein